MKTENNNFIAVLMPSSERFPELWFETEQEAWKYIYEERSCEDCKRNTNINACAAEWDVWTKDEYIEMIDTYDYKVKFSEVLDNQLFECYGDINLNYSYPKICRCIKINEDTAQEVNGIRFGISPNDWVFVNK